jgi:hypothetical protein
MSLFVIGADTLVAKQAVVSAGIHGVLIQALWDQLQPNGAGSSLVSSAVNALNQQITDARSLGLKVAFEYAPHYPPTWVKSGIEAFTDQNNSTYTSADPGKDVRNWVWTALGRQYIEDFYTKVYNALSTENRAALVFLKFGGSYYGEIQYPTEVGSTPFRYWGFGNAMQTGIGLANGLSVCPVPGYTPFTGTDAQDVLFINWYLHGLEDFVSWQISLLKSLGFTCKLYAMHSGYSVRNNQGRASDGYRENFARGQDFTRMLGQYKNDPQVWPWCTWIGGYDGWTPNTYDSDQAAWKKLYSVASARGKHYQIGGENTGGESNATMDTMFSELINPTTGPIYSDGRPQTAWTGYKDIMWLNYANLTAGGGNATLTHFGEKG